MAHTVSEVSALVKKCNQLSKEVLELRQEQENRAIEIQKRDAEISELKGMIKLLKRGASSCVDSERRLALENDTLLAANQDQSRELNDRMGEIRKLQAELKKTRLNGDEAKGQLRSLRSEVSAAYEHIQQLETENAQLKADLNVAIQEYKATAFTSHHLPQQEEKEEDDDDDEDEGEYVHVGNCYTARAAGNRREARKQVPEQGAEDWKHVERGRFLHVLIDRRELKIPYDPEMKIVAIKHRARKIYENLFDFGCLKDDNRRVKISPNDTRTLAEVGIPPNATLRFARVLESCNLL